jgi:hypothetical protein
LKLIELKAFSTKDDFKFKSTSIYIPGHFDLYSTVKVHPGLKVHCYYKPSMPVATIKPSRHNLKEKTMKIHHQSMVIQILLII